TLTLKHPSPSINPDNQALEFKGDLELLIGFSIANILGLANANLSVRPKFILALILNISLNPSFVKCNLSIIKLYAFLNNS
ncbi:hypothetical protein HOY80DRAFT_897685, partial [Tuber brumale]